MDPIDRHIYGDIDVEYFGRCANCWRRIEVHSARDLEALEELEAAGEEIWCEQCQRAWHDC